MNGERLVNHIIEKKTNNSNSSNDDEEYDDEDDDENDGAEDFDDDINTNMPEDWTERKKLSKAVNFPNAIRHFCRFCMIFGCAVHEGMQTTSRKPIAEPKRDERVSKVNRRQIPPCSPLCYMLLNSTGENMTHGMNMNIHTITTTATTLTEEKAYECM